MIGLPSSFTKSAIKGSNCEANKKHKSILENGERRAQSMEKSTEKKMERAQKCKRDIPDWNELTRGSIASILPLRTTRNSANFKQLEKCIWKWEAGRKGEKKPLTFFAQLFPQDPVSFHGYEIAIRFFPNSSVQIRRPQMCFPRSPYFADPVIFRVGKNISANFPRTFLRSGFVFLIRRPS